MTKFITLTHSKQIITNVQFVQIVTDVQFVQIITDVQIVTGVQFVKIITNVQFVHIIAMDVQFVHAWCVGRTRLYINSGPTTEGSVPQMLCRNSQAQSTQNHYKINTARKQNI